MAIIGPPNMRTFLIVVALSSLAAHAADEPQPANPAPGIGSAAEEVVVVTASRAPKNVMTEPASVSRLGADEIAELSPKHQA